MKEVGLVALIEGEQKVLESAKLTQETMVLGTTLGEPHVKIEHLSEKSQMNAEKPCSDRSPDSLYRFLPLGICFS